MKYVFLIPFPCYLFGGNGLSRKTFVPALEGGIVLGRREIKNGPPSCGQLAQDYFRKPEGLPLHLIIALSYCAFNKLTKPGFIAYKFEHRNNKALARILAARKIPEVLWTIATPRGYEEAMKKGIVPIFEKIEPEEIGLVKVDSKK